MELNIQQLINAANDHMKKKNVKEAITCWYSFLEYQKANSNEDSFLDKSRNFQKNKHPQNAIQVLRNGLLFHPNSQRIKKELVKLLLFNMEWKQAISLIRNKKLLSKLNVYPKLGKALRLDQQYQEAESILKQGLTINSNDIKILIELAELAMVRKDWEEAVNLWNTLHQMDQMLSGKDYVRMAVSYKMYDDLKRAEEIIQEGIAKNPDNKKLLIENAEIAMAQKNWNVAEERWKIVFKVYGDDLPPQTFLDRSITNQIIGEKEAAESYFGNFLAKTEENNKKKYKKVILFDNGKTRIEFYKKLSPTNTVCITFDSINIVWHDDAFGFKFLMKQDIDIIAVRRKSKNNYHQDLTREVFVTIVQSLANTYKKRVAYGFSLGGYTSLYYGSSLNCDILSLSPRISAHPSYGDKLKDKIEFTHSLSHPVNPDIAPVIVYDPKDFIDKRYIEKELKVSYPSAIFYECPYAGHRTAPYFQQMGVLKELVISALHGDVLPNFDRKLRWKSHQYLRVLGQACLRRNKSKWALNFAELALEKAPNDPKASMLKIQALGMLRKSEETKAISNSTVKAGVKKIKEAVGGSYRYLILLFLSHPSFLDLIEISQDAI